MKNLFKSYINRFLSYSRSDRNAILILSAILIVSIVANYIVRSIDPNSSQDFSEIKTLIDKWEKEQEENSKYKLRLYSFNPNTATIAELDSLLLPNFIKRNIINYRKAGGKFKSVNDLRKIYGMNDSIFTKIKPYVHLPDEKDKVSEPRVLGKTKLIKSEPVQVLDPNSATREELESFGFNRFQIKNILKYRENGGKFISKQDLKKIYGVDSVFFNGIEKSIVLKEVEDTIEIKESVFEIVELNSADTVDLMTLPGIGTVYAQRILKYRDLLGGYYSKEQLLEVYNLKEETYSGISAKVKVDTLLVKKLRINFSDYKELIKHPYLKKEHVRAILKQREELGPFNSVLELKKNKVFDQERIERIEPYISCR